MSKAEMEKRIKELDERRFLLSMKDRWNSNDYARDREMLSEVMSLKKAVAEMVVA